MNRCIAFLAAWLVFHTGLLAADKPNIVFILGDDMGYADVGYHGCKDIPTPHLDQLAAGGVRFTNGYVSGPYCSPTRAGLLTGRYQTRFGHEFNPGAGQGMPVSEKTIADRLAAAGYKTALVGKWHLGSQPGMHPLERGFQEFFGFLPGAHDYFDDRGIFRGKEPVAEDAYLTDAFGREAVAFIEKNKSQPFFLYLTFNAVHTPMQADDPRLKKFAHIEDKTRRTYAAMMSAMDDNIGLVLGKLKELGLDKKTLVCFISDNGGPTMPGTTINGSVNAPFRGSKRTTLEGGIRVPFVISWPGTLQPGKFDELAIQLDLHATALAVAGVEITPEMKLDGVNLLPHLQGEAKNPPHDALYWRFGAQMAIRVGDYKLVRYDLAADLDPNNPRGISSVKLYNLKDDMGEMKDLAADMPEKVKELQTKWDAWNKDNVPPAWGNPTGQGKGKQGAGNKNKKKAE
jgi:arylsulfatase A-like enzyme